MTNKYEVNGLAKKHLPVTTELFKHIAEVDFTKCGDYFCFKSGGDGDNGEVLMDEIDDYFINADRYRWHDLRKNPDDLPKSEWEQVVVCVRTEYDEGEAEITYDFAHYRKLASGQPYWDTFCDANYFAKEKVIAWKYFSPFEGRG